MESHMLDHGELGERTHPDLKPLWNELLARETDSLE